MIIGIPQNRDTRHFLGYDIRKRCDGQRKVGDVMLLALELEEEVHKPRHVGGL